MIDSNHMKVQEFHHVLVCAKFAHILIQLSEAVRLCLLAIMIREIISSGYHCRCHLTILRWMNVHNGLRALRWSEANIVAQTDKPLRGSPPLPTIPRDNTNSVYVRDTIWLCCRGPYITRLGR